MIRRHDGLVTFLARERNQAMSDYETTMRSSRVPVEILAESARARFIMRTYYHLLGAIALFVAIEVGLFVSGAAYALAELMLGTSWLLILGGFVVVSWLASRAAATATALGTQYAALVGFVVAEAIIFVPLLVLAQMVAGGGVIESAALTTAAGFAGLTFIAFQTRKDFRFLGGMLRWLGVSALVLIVAGVIFGFGLGTWFSVAMIVFAGAAVLYDTSNIIRHYPEDRYVSAALELFASIALMFWYILRLFLAMSRR
jgi:FtsH-binding integral membrane protein